MAIPFDEWLKDTKKITVDDLLAMPDGDIAELEDEYRKETRDES